MLSEGRSRSIFCKRSIMLHMSWIQTQTTSERSSRHSASSLKLRFSSSVLVVIWQVHFLSACQADPSASSMVLLARQAPPTSIHFSTLAATKCWKDGFSMTGSAAKELPVSWRRFPKFKDFLRTKIGVQLSIRDFGWMTSRVTFRSITKICQQVSFCCVQTLWKLKVAKFLIFRIVRLKSERLGNNLI